nr:uncharacterized protein LOC111419521 [Onthophagus taurus]
MAYVHVKEWNVDQVIEWLKGLDGVVLSYTNNFLNNEITGTKVLDLTASDLENLGVTIIGHQEILLEAIQHLKNFYYDLDKENLQLLALRLSCAARSLHNELKWLDKKTGSIPTEVMSEAHNVIQKVKPIVSWLTRRPFINNREFAQIQSKLLNLCVEMAFSAHRDTFSENPLDTIQNACHQLTYLADHMVQYTDPLILQPAALNLTTVRKKEQELGLFIFPNYHLIHQIAEFKHNSPASLSNKLEIGDEIVQVNYQTVVGWQRQNVMLLLRDSPPEVVLTLKKLPQMSKIYGPIYIKPYRLPSKKRATPYSRWNENLPSPRLLTVNDLPQIPAPKPAPAITELESDSSSDNDMDPPDSPLDGPRTLYPMKSSRPVLQRRNTISGATPSNQKAYPGLEQFLQMYKHEAFHSSSYNHIQNNFEDEATLLRDKSASCSHGLELSVRPTTVIGLSPNRKDRQNSLKLKKVVFQEAKPKNVIKEEKICVGEVKSVSVNSLNSLTGSNANIDFIDEAEDITDRSNMGADDQHDEGSEKDKMCAELKNVHVHNIIKKFDEKIILLESNPAVINNAVRAKIQNRFVSVTEKDTKDVETKVWEYNLANKQERNTPDSSEGIKYELGIPVVETKNSYMIMTPGKDNVVDVPPKPPPRTYYPDNYKPKYPIDSPKPPIETPKKRNKDIPPLPPPRSDEKRITEITENEPILSKVQEEIVKPDIIENTPESCSRKIIESKASSIKRNKLEVEDGKITSPVVKSSSMSKVSPTNSIVRAMIYPNKGKSAKKKNTLTARKRKVSVADVTPGDMEGYLFQRFRPKDGQAAYWDKLWFILIGNRLYGFTSKEATKANVLIYLTGFTVSLASEVKSKSYAFKVYYTGTIFYFSAETQETMSGWMEMISDAILRSDLAKPDESVLYSETDDSDTEKPKSPTEKSPGDGIKKFGSLKKFTSKKNNDTSHSLDRKWFFNKSTSSKSSVPIPTAQFRSYRKILTTPMESVSTGNFTSHIPNFATNFSSPQNVSVPNLVIELPKTSLLTMNKNKTKNFSHASNPSLYNLNEFNASFLGSHHTRDNFAGCMTLEELMKKQQEEQKINQPHLNEAINIDLIKPDVVYGEVPIRPKEKVELKKKNSFSEKKNDSTSFCFGKKSSKIDDSDFNMSTYPKSKHQDLKNNRSLPRAHKIHPTYDQAISNTAKQYSDSCRSLAKVEDNEDEYNKDVANSKLKSAIQYTPMTVPLSDDKSKLNPKLAFELNLDEKNHKGGGGFMNLFYKSNREKVTSPKLGRLILSKNNSGNNDNTYQSQIQSYSTPVYQHSHKTEENLHSQISQHVDYPDLEYPPVFQAETYSLSDPQSLTLLRKQARNT